MFYPIMFILGVAGTSLSICTIMVAKAFDPHGPVAHNIFKILCCVGCYWIVLLTTTIIDIVCENVIKSRKNKKNVHDGKPTS